MKWTPWSLFFFFWGGGGGDDESSRWGHSPRMRGGSGEGSLPNYFRWEFILFIKTHFYRGHSLNISWRSTHPLYLYFLFTRWRHEMEICSALLALCAGNSQVTGELPSQRPMTQSFDVFFWPNGWVNNQDADYLRRHRARYDVTVMWCRIVIQWSGQPWDLSAFNASLLSNFELVKRVKLGGSVLYGRNGLKVGTLLYPDYHSLKLTTFCTQQQFKFAMSYHPWISFEMGRK